MTFIPQIYGIPFIVGFKQGLALVAESQNAKRLVLLLKKMTTFVEGLVELLQNEGNQPGLSIQACCQSRFIDYLNY